MSRPARLKPEKTDFDHKAIHDAVAEHVVYATTDIECPLCSQNPWYTHSVAAELANTLDLGPRPGHFQIGHFKVCIPCALLVTLRQTNPLPDYGKNVPVDDPVAGRFPGPVTR